jgi:DNA-binding HxlR family transcriptional regulator
MYDDGCVIAHAMNVIGERWSILIVRELLLGPKRFTDLDNALRNVGPNVLAQRLRDLETSGVLRRRTLPPPASSRVYQLTEWGAELGPVLAGLARWGATSPVTAPAGPAGADSLMLGLRTFFKSASRPWAARFNVVLGADHYAVSVSDRGLDVTRGQHTDADATLITDTATFSALLEKSIRIKAAMDDRRLTADGNVALLQRLITAVAIPQPHQQSHER